jgi:hypothetical protein
VSRGSGPGRQGGRAGRQRKGLVRDAGIVLATLALVACSSGQKVSTGRTERETDSVIGNSSIPGASGVKKAMAEQDSARARAAALDSIGSE